MKRIYINLVLSAALLTGTQAFGQQGETRGGYYPGARSKPVSFIPVAGITYNEIKGGNTDYDFDTGFTAGALIDLGEGSTVFETGLLYTTLNTKYDFGSVASFKVKQSFASIPLQGKTYLQGGQEGGYLRYGSLVNVVTSAETEVSGIFGSEKENIKKELTKVDPLAVLGIGVMAQSTTIAFSVDVSWNRSLIPINKDKSEVKLYNQAFMLNVGVRL